MLDMEELKWIFVSQNEDGTKTYRPPNQSETMEKINEMVRFLNYLNREKQRKPILPVGKKRL